MVNGKKVAGGIRSQDNTRGLQLECGKGLDEGLLMPVLLHAVRRSTEEEVD